MMKRFRKKLRMAGLEDSLRHELNLSSSASEWLCRLAQDCGRQHGLDILSVRADVLTDTVFWQLERSGHQDLLNRLAADNERFSHRLEFYRDSRTSAAA
ncbi:MAG: hypothetical protein HRT76_03405 [Halieaceae bacterium]|nr:hypothetical protein [Halieaceae bacterium]